MNIKETVKTPSRALELMLEGLLDPNRPFTIDMGTFGQKTKTECFGCAATCASYKLLGDAFSVDIEERYDAAAMSSNSLEIGAFEGAMDDARKGFFNRLFEFFGINWEESNRWTHRIRLETSNWKDQVEEIEKVILEMREAGF